MVFAVAEEVVFDPLKHRTDIIPAPAGEAELAPVIVVGGLAAHRNHRVDRRAAADHLAARVGEGPPVQASLGFGPVHPVGARVADCKQVADRDVEPDPVVVAAAFEHQHFCARVSGEPVRQDATGGARTDHDVVEIAFEPPCRFHDDLFPYFVIARREATKHSSLWSWPWIASLSSSSGRPFGRTRWLAMTIITTDASLSPVAPQAPASFARRANAACRPSCRRPGPRRPSDSAQTRR